MIRTLRPRSVYDVLAVLAFFIALATGTAYAANSVFSTDIVDGQVKTADLDNGAVAVAKLADGAITGDKIKDAAIQGRDVLDNNLKGVDIDESTLSSIVAAGGPAGGDLAGTYPDPVLQYNSVGASHLKHPFAVIKSEEIQKFGSPVNKFVIAQCPTGARAVGGGGLWEFPDGQLSTVFIGISGVLVSGTNYGNGPADLTAEVLCLPS